MKKLNIVIPCYNESARLSWTLISLSKFIKKSKSLDINLYIVNDGSTDNTVELALTIMNDYKIPGEVLSYRTNRGKGYAVRTGVLKSRKADYYYVADSDLSSDWDTLNLMLKTASNGNLDCVIGSRGLDSSEVTSSFIKKLAGSLSNSLIRGFLGLNIKDTQCGYKLFTSKCLPAFMNLSIDRWGFDFELLYLLKEMGIKVKELPLIWVNKAGSKVSTFDYFTTLNSLILLTLRIKLSSFTRFLGKLNPLAF